MTEHFEMGSAREGLCLPGRRILPETRRHAAWNVCLEHESSPYASANIWCTAGFGDDGLWRGMVGLMLGHEQFSAPQLVDFGVAAERAGFDLLATSDHLQPWQANEGHSGQAWVTMGSLCQKTRRVWMGPTVTCPTFRYSPAVVAEAFATLSLFSPGRIFLGMGSGEALNEQAAIGSWPAWNERSERLS